MRVEIDVHYTTQALNIVNSIRIHYLQNLDLSFMCMRVIVYTIVEHSFRNSGRQREKIQRGTSSYSHKSF